LTATAGGLVFTGDVDGELIALDAASGAPLYQSNLGAGALDGGVVTYEAKGKQFVAVAGETTTPCTRPRAIMRSSFSHCLEAPACGNDVPAAKGGQ
jgi:glucose dehydrogenase